MVHGALDIKTLEEQIFQFIRMFGTPGNGHYSPGTRLKMLLKVVIGAYSTAAPTLSQKPPQIHGFFIPLHYSVLIP